MTTPSPTEFIRHERERWTRSSRAFKWTVRVVVGGPLILALVVLLLMRSPVVGWAVRSQIRDQTGGELRAGSMVIRVDGRLIVRNAVLRAPGLDGPEGELMRAERAEVVLDWSDVFGSGLRVREVLLNKPVFRLSQSGDDATVNLGELSPGGAPSAASELPQIHVVEGTVEFAEHSSRLGTFDLLQTIRVGGSMKPLEGSAGVYTVGLQEIGRTPTLTGSARGMTLTGQIDLTRGVHELTLRNLPLEAFTPEGVPSAYREIWRRLAIQGQVKQIEFKYEEATGVRLDLSLRDVSLDLPLEGRSPEGVVSDNLSVTDVTGVISLSTAGVDADVMGVLEGQTEASRVRFETRGLSVNSALRCEVTARDLRVDRNPAFYAFVSPQVRRYFEMFSGPTARFDARLVIFRGEPVDGAAAPVRVTDGRLVFREGTAAYDDFPYPFHDMSGIAEFDDNKLIMRDVRGVGPTGATMTSSARIEPLDRSAEVEVFVSARGVPLDEHLLEAMPEGDRRVIEQVFSDEQYARLLGEGHVMTGERREELRQRLDAVQHRLESMMLELPAMGPEVASLLEESASLVRKLEMPAFDLGGPADIELRVHSPRGAASGWSVDVDVRLAEAGVLPEAFAYPIRARNVHVRVTGERVEVVEGEYAGLTGGTASLTAVVERQKGKDEDGKPLRAKPRIRIEARDIPVNELLVRAIPETEAEGGGAWYAGDEERIGPPPPPLSAQEILRSLSVEGSIDCVALIGEGPSKAQPIRHDVTVKLDGIAVEPKWRPEDRTLRLESLRGSLNVDPDRLLIESLEGELWERSLSDEMDRKRAASLRLSMLASLGGSDVGVEGERPKKKEDRARVSVRAESLRLDSPLEVLVSAFSTEAGSLVNNLRAELRPRGLIDVDLRLERALGVEYGKEDEDERTRLWISRAQDVSVEFMGGRLGFDLREGGAEMVQDPDGVLVTFDGVDADLRFDGQPCGRVVAQGRLGLTPAMGLREPADASGEIAGVPIESALVAGLIREALGEERAVLWREAEVTGEVRIDARVGMEDGAPTIEASLRPLVVGLGRAGDGDALEGGVVTGRVTLRASSGRVRSAEGEGAEGRGGSAVWTLRGLLDDLRFTGGGFEARMGGEWSFDGDAGFALSAEGEASGASFTPGHAALLPGDAREAVESIELRMDEAWRLSGVRLTVAAPTGGAPVVGFESVLGFAEASIDPGVKVGSASGSMRIDVRTDRAEAPIRLELEGVDARVQGVQVRRVSALLETGSAGSAALEGAGTRVEIRSMIASCHGGRVYGSGSIETRGEVRTDGVEGEGERSAALSGAAYRMDFMAAGVAFAPLLEDLAASAEDRAALVVEGELVEELRAAERLPDASRGVLDAWVSLAGRAGEPSTRVGRGSLRVTSGQVLRLPVVFQLMQVSNLVLPSNDRLDYLQAVCHVEGERISFPMIALMSESISVLGFGTIQLPDLRVDMTFNSRANTRVPILSDVLEVMRNELVTTRITGTVAEPEVSSSPLVGTRRFFSGLFDGEREAAGAFTSEAVESIRRERERIRRLTDTQRERGRERERPSTRDRRDGGAVGLVEP
ncbi:MAG: hypothetical protein KF768_01905 [Phycisphaeraceae bacterium]|nr:hypothetical protein [Phycisphaeraceae bacterium]